LVLHAISSPLMSWLTLDLIRRRSEHHEGLLSELTELDLHQDHLVSVGPVLGQTCRKLQSLFLHNNVIRRLEKQDWQRLNEIRFLCLALNNLTAIENLEQCELLEHLDVSFNFVSLSALGQSIQSLRSLRHLRHLFILGNPCEREWSGCRAYIVASLPNLQYVDGKHISNEERDTANLILGELQDDLASLAVSGCGDYENFRIARESMDREWTKNQRRIDEERKRSLSSKSIVFSDPRKPGTHASIVEQTRREESSGERRNTNEGCMEYKLEYEDHHITMRVTIPKDTPDDHVDLDAGEDYASLIVQGQVLRLRLPHRIDVPRIKAERSLATGNLMIILPLENRLPQVCYDDKEKSSTRGLVPPVRQSNLSLQLLEESHNSGATADHPAAAKTINNGGGDSEEPPPLY